MALNSKLGDFNQNSYVTATQANSYMDTKQNTSEWDNLSTTASKENVLQQAARDLDYFNFIDEKYYDSQGLAFPRDSHETVTGNPATPLSATSFKNSNMYSTTYNNMPNNYWK